MIVLTMREGRDWRVSVRQRISRGCFFCAALVTLALRAAPAGAYQAEVSDTPELDAGFHLLYELKLEEARAKFAAWQASHPEDPLESAAEAASYLFEECYRQGVLTSEFFLNDKRFLGKVALQPDPDLRDAFFAADLRAQHLARIQLETDPNDKNALFAMTIGLGMQADYIRKADTFANQLLAVNPDAADAYLTLGAANFIIGSLSALKRFFVHLKGISGDKAGGIRQLEIAAARGRYLRPFAKIILAMAALREKKTALARFQLMDLVTEFPENPLFVGELAKLDALIYNRPEQWP
jgi:hypothetical protein